MTVNELIAQLQSLPDKEIQVGISCGCRDHRTINKLELEPHLERYFDEDYKQQIINTGNWYILK